MSEPDYTAECVCAQDRRMVSSRCKSMFDRLLAERNEARAEGDVARRVRTATVIHPGDHVLLTTIEPFEQDFVSMMTELRSRFPGVEFTIVAGVTDIAVERSPWSPGLDERAQQDAENMAEQWAAEQ